MEEYENSYLNPCHMLGPVLEDATRIVRAEHKRTIARPLILERCISKALQDSPEAETSRGVRGGGGGGGWSLGGSPCARRAREPGVLAGMRLETELQAPLLFAWLLGIFS